MPNVRGWKRAGSACPAMRWPSGQRRPGIPTRCDQPKYVRWCHDASSGARDIFDLSSEASNIQYTIQNIPGGLADELSDLLLCNGALSATIVEHRPEGADEEEIFKEKFGSSEFWKVCAVQCCFLYEGKSEDGHRESINAALAWLGADQDVLEGVTISAGEEIQPRNWQQAILDEYQEMRIADDLMIVPTWCVEEGTVKNKGVSSIILNPGIAFGTGDHPTTRMCLQWINSLRNTNHGSLLDYGTGSGVLAIAALVLDVAKTCHGTDIEPLSIKASTHNASLNGVQDRFTAELVTGDGIVEAAGPKEGTTYDIVVANILQGPLKALAPLLASKSHTGTLLALSGITSGQAAEIQEAYEAVGFRNFSTRVDSGSETPSGHQWVVITGQYASLHDDNE